MRIGPIAHTLGIIVCVVAGLIRVYGSNWVLVSHVTQDDMWTVIEYPEGHEVVVELKPGESMPNGRGTARVMNSGHETTISIEVTGLNNEKNHKVYIIDSLGNATLLGQLPISEGAGNLSGKTALSKFMIVLSADEDLTSIGPETKVTLRSIVPSGFTVVAQQKSENEENSETVAGTSSVENSGAEIPDYDVPLLDIGSLKQGANTMMRANFSNGFEGTRANVLIKPRKNRLTQIKMRFTNLKEPMEGTQYVLWEVMQDNAYLFVGRLSHASNKRESKIDAETAATDFGLLITAESAGATPSTPTGDLVATIVR